MLAKFKIVLVGMPAVFVFVFAMATATAFAAAPTWSVNGTRVAAGLKFTIALEAAIATEARLVIPFGGDVFEISCPKVEVESGFIEGTKNSGAEHIVFTGCAVVRPEGCAVLNGKIISAEVRSELLANEVTPQVTFKPLNGTAFAKVILRKGIRECGPNGIEFTVGGVANGIIVKPTEDAVLKELSFKTGAGELTADGEEVKLTTVVSLKLSSGLIWGVA